MEGSFKHEYLFPAEMLVGIEAGIGCPFNQCHVLSFEIVQREH